MSTEDKKIQLGVEVDATAARSGFADVKAGAKDMAQAVATAGQQGAKGLDGIGAGGDAAAARVDKATRSMIGSVQRATAALQAGERGSSSYFETLAAQRGVSGDVLKPYIEQLKAAETAQLAASGSLNKMGVSAAQTAAAMRQVPAQFSDIVVSLQSGQAPLTVLLQQGSQLKDSFGGIGNAARVLATYMAGLLTPVTLLAGAAAALGLAYYKGDQEGRVFNRTLIETGGASGRTVGELALMAAEMGNLGTTQGAAAAGLNAFLGTVDLGAAELQRFTLAAIKLADAGGPAIEDTAKAFAELGKAPLEASIKFNQSMNYLTASVYEQIKALVEQGRTTDAARIAQGAFFDAIDERAPKMVKNLGYLESAWAGVTSQVKRAADAMLSVGRTDGLDEQIKSKRELIAGLENPGFLQRTLSTDADRAKGIAARKAELAVLEEAARIEGRRASSVAQQADLTKQLIGYDAEVEKNKTKQAKMEEEINSIKKRGADLVSAGLKTEKQVAEDIQAVREKYAEKAVKAPKIKTDAFSAESLKAYTQSMYELERIQLKASASSESLSNTQEALRKIQSSPEWAQFNFRKQEEIILAASLAQAAEDEVEAKKQAKAATEEYATALEAQQRAANGLQDQVAKEREQVAAIGLTKEAVAELAVARMEELALTKERLAAILPETEQGKAMAQAYREQAAALREMAGLKREGAAKEVAVDAAKKAAEEWKRTAEQIESSITDSLMRGFESGKGFAENLRDTVVNMFKTLVLRPVVSAIVSPVAAVLAGSLGASGAAAAGQGGAAGALGQVGAASNTLSGANTLASMKGWLTDFGGGVSSQVSKLGNYLSSFSNSTVSEWGNGLMENASAIGEYAQVAGNALGYFNAAMAASEGKWGQAVGTAVGTYFGGPIGAAIGGAVGGWIDNAFGGGREYTTGQGITGTFSSSGFSGRNYQTWQNDGSSGFFGIGASGSSSGTNYSALDASTASGLSKAFYSVQSQTADFAESLGLSADTILGFSKSVSVALGADAEANKTAIQNLLTGIADDLAKTVLDTQYIREGEAAASTLARLATNLAAVNGAFDGLGKTALSASQFGGDAASQLVDLLGGLSAFQSTTLSYYQTYYTEQERNAKTSEQLAKSFADLGIAVPDSLEAFRSLVNAQDVTTESGRATYAALMNLSAAFATVTNAAADAASTLIVAAKYSTYADYAAAAAGAGLTPAPRFAAGGMHSGGLRIVGENGPELEATGPSRIWNDSQIRGALTGGDSTDMAAAIERLDANLQAQASATVRLQNAMVKIFDRWDHDGMPEVRPTT
jgi:phage-related minor tail protein